MDKTKVAEPPPGAAQKPPDMREIMADYDKAVKFFHEMPAEAWEGLGMKTAMTVFQETVEKVPVYRELLATCKIEASQIQSVKDFSKIPIIDKYNYVQKYGFNEINTTKAGENLYSVSLSSGTVDEPTIWPRYYQYEEFLPTVFDLFLRQYWQIEKKSSLVIDAFAFGSWMAGVSVNAAIRPLTQKHKMMLATTGADVESIVYTVKKLSQFYDQTILMSYPTFARTVLDRLEDAGINIRKLNLKIFIAGEGHTVEWHHYINKMATGNAEDLTTIVDGYGITDTGLSGMGTALTNLIRDLAFKDTKLCEALFGQTDYVPALFQFNTANYYMEENNGEVVITTKSTTPLVRYNIHDRGGVIKFREMENILQKHGYDYKKLIRKRGLPEDIIVEQPFVYCLGRGSDTIIVGGANIFPEQIAPVLFNEKVKDIHSFKIAAKYDVEQHQIFSVMLELRNGISYNSRQLNKARQKFRDLIVKHLQGINMDYADAYRIDQKVCTPAVEIFENGNGPFESDKKRTKPILVLKA